MRDSMLRLSALNLKEVRIKGWGKNEENEENMLWFMNNHPFKLESIDPYLPEELHSETTALGYLQLLPGVHKTDGFFIAKFRRK